MSYKRLYVALVYDSLSHMYNSVSHMYNSVSRKHTSVSHRYDSVSRMYCSASRTYNSVSHLYDLVSRMHCSVSRKYNSVSHIYGYRDHFNINITAITRPLFILDHLLLDLSGGPVLYLIRRAYHPQLFTFIQFIHKKTILIKLVNKRFNIFRKSGFLIEHL